MAIAASVSTTNSFSRARTRALRSSTESFRINCFQPRLGGQLRPTSSPDNRDMTVPTGTPTTAAMFLYERPSSSRSTMTSRKSTGSDSTAVCTCSFAAAAPTLRGRGCHRVARPSFPRRASRDVRRPVSPCLRTTCSARSPAATRAHRHSERRKEAERADSRVLQHVLGVGVALRQPSRLIERGVQMRRYHCIEIPRGHLC